MMALALLIAALAMPGLAGRCPRAALPLDVAALALAALAGLGIPDLDQRLPLLAHRDALTHSVLPALLALGRPTLRPVAAGLALGLGLHLSADSFPNAMTGYATVKLPFAGSLGSWSYPWLGGHAVAGLLLFALLIDRGWPKPVRRALIAGAGLLGLTYLARVDGGWWALAAYAGVAAAGWRWREGLRRWRLPRR